MDWITTALLSATIHAGVGILDSHILSRRKLGLRAFMMMMGILQLILGTVVSLLNPWWFKITTESFLLVAGASVTGSVAAMIIFYVLQKEEVSRVIPITHISPLFVALSATIFLNESLGWLHWLAIVIVVGGAIIISLEKRGQGKSLSLDKPFLLLLLSSLLIATRAILLKEGLEDLTFWNVYGMSALGTGLLFSSLALRPEVIRQWLNHPRRGSTFLIFLTNEIIAFISTVLQIRAISLGPVSLVSAIIATRPVLVALFSIILSIILPGFLLELPGKRAMIVRLAAILMIVGGICIIYLN